MGISGGMVRLKGNSPKVSTKDSNNRPRVKQYGNSNSSSGMSAGLGNVGSIGQVGGGVQSSGYGIRNIQSSKGMNRPQQNNLMMSQQVMGTSHLSHSANQGFANS